VWARVRAAWARKGIDNYGFRVAEPHHDGTPHWHLMLFIPAEQEKQASEIFKRYALEEDGNERGAEEYRFKAVTIDPKKGSATGYIAKYISKNIDGHGLEADLYGRDAASSAARIGAWASVWRIRQFQQIGGPSVTVWRELRRLEAQEVDQETLQKITQAADEGNWEDYIELMGGATCPREARPLRPYLIKKTEMNHYGEFTKKLKGLFFGPTVIITRLQEWTIRPAANNTEDNKQEANLSARANELAASMAAVLRAPPQACAPLEFCQ
jgi:hypothetical protein